MKFSGIVSLLAIATSSASAAALPGFWSSWKGGVGFRPGPPVGGLSEVDGREIVAQFVSLLTNFSSSVATNLLSPVTFADASDSINVLSGLPLGSTTFNCSTAFIYGQGAQAAIDVNVTAVDTVAPTGVITFRWVALAGLKTARLSGIDVLYASNDAAVGGGAGNGVNGWVLTKVYSEFNSAEWVRQIGGSVTL